MSQLESHARECVDEECRLVRLDPTTPSLSTAAYAVFAAVGPKGCRRMKLVFGKLLAIFWLGMLGQLSGRIGQLLGLDILGVNRSAWKLRPHGRSASRHDKIHGF